VRRSLIVAGLKAVVLAGCVWTCRGSAFAAEAAEQMLDDVAEKLLAEEITGPRPMARLARISTSEAPAIDADLSDLSWAKATVITDFKQREPDPGGPPTERTVLRIMYDDNNFYLSVYAYDSEPDRVIVRSMSRDGEVVQEATRKLLEPAATEATS